MSMTIPSPVLARLQVLFSAGATMEEAARALEIELAGDAVAIDGGHLDALKTRTRSLGKKVDSLFQLQRLREVPEVAGALDLIAHEAHGIMQEIKALESPGSAESAEAAAAPLTRRSKPTSRPSRPSLDQSAPTSRPSAHPPSRTEAVSPVAVPSSDASPAPAAAPAARPDAVSQAPAPAPSLVPAPVPPVMAGPVAAVPVSQAKPPSQVVAPPSRAAAPPPAPAAPAPAQEQAQASRPSPGRLSRNPLSRRIASVVDQISAIAADHPSDGSRPSAQR